MNQKTDIVILGGGIAGLWVMNRLKCMGYNILLLESTTIGCGQTIASQGILHSGLKYALAGKISPLAARMRAMPDIWRAALNGRGPVDLSAARVLANSQMLLIPQGLMSGIMSGAVQKALGQGTHEIPPSEDLQRTGFKGRIVHMGEPVLDIPSVLTALCTPHKDCIRKIDTPDDPFGFLARHNISAKTVIVTAAGANAKIARTMGHDGGLKTQTRPLLMGMLKPAPFPLYAHFVGTSEKPVLTITTHTMKDGTPIWYLGGAATERAKDSDPREVYKAAQKAFAAYFPDLDFKNVEWASLPIDRFEGTSGSDDFWLPDTPTIHQVDYVLYGWPTKLTFAPLLADRLIEKIDFAPSGTQTDWSCLPPVDISETVWDTARWKEEH